jgi:hypothetical protein
MGMQSVQQQGRIETAAERDDDPMLCERQSLDDLLKSLSEAVR